MTGVHDGHRERLRQRYGALGPDAFADHELLELLLTYAIPRRDTNETAHLLLKRFGSLSGVLGARRGLPGVIAIGEVSGIAAAVLLAVAAATSSWLPALGAAACLGLGYILVQPTLVTLSMEADPERVGLCTGLIGFGVFAGGGVGSMLGGTVLAAVGYLGLWLVVAALLLVQLIVSKRVL